MTFSGNDLPDIAFPHNHPCFIRAWNVEGLSGWRTGQHWISKAVFDFLRVPINQLQPNGLIIEAYGEEEHKSLGSSQSPLQVGRAIRPTILHAVDAPPSYNNLLLGRPCLIQVVSSATDTKKYDFPYTISTFFVSKSLKFP